jgi:hypothetical protein
MRAALQTPKRNDSRISGEINHRRENVGQVVYQGHWLLWGACHPSARKVFLSGRLDRLNDCVILKSLTHLRRTSRSSSARRLGSSPGATFPPWLNGGAIHEPFTLSAAVLEGSRNL